MNASLVTLVGDTAAYPLHPTHASRSVALSARSAQLAQLAVSAAAAQTAPLAPAHSRGLVPRGLRALWADRTLVVRAWRDDRVGL